MLNLSVPALLMSLAVAPPDVAPVAISSASCVRALTPTMARVLGEAVARSPLIRAQVAILDHSDVVVYITDSMATDSADPKGTLRLQAATGNTRYLIVCIDRWKSRSSDQIALLGHELQHALEIAAAPEVRDAASFRALYRRIGWEMGRGRFETEAARRAGAAVWGEVTGRRP